MMQTLPLIALTINTALIIFIITLIWKASAFYTAVNLKLNNIEMSINSIKNNDLKHVSDGLGNLRYKIDIYDTDITNMKKDIYKILNVLAINEKEE